MSTVADAPAVTAPAVSTTRRHLDAALAVLVGGIALALYLRTMSRTFGWGDASELTTAAYFLGVGHSPGYPTWMLLAYPFAHLPFGTVAWRVNFMNALVGAVAVGVLYLVFYRVSRHRAAAFVGALSFATTVTFWDLNTEADVHTLYVCFAALALFFLLRWRDTKQDRNLYWLALVTGLALGNHLLILLLIPALLFLVWSERGARYALSRFALLGLACLFLTALLYLYLPLRGAANPPPHSNSPRTVREVWRVMTAPQARPAMFRAPVATVGHRMLENTKQLKEQFTWGGVALGALGLLVLLRRDWKLAVTFLLVGVLGVVYAANFSIFDIYAYYAPLHIMWAAFIAAGASLLLAGGARLVRRLEKREVAISPLRSYGVLTLALLYLPAWQYWSHLAYVDKHDSREAEQFARFVMRDLPPKAAFLGDWWAVAPLGYVKYVESQRPDLTLCAASSQPKEEDTRRYAQAGFLDTFPAVYFAEKITHTMHIFRDSCYLAPEAGIPLDQGPSLWRVYAHRPPAEDVLADLPPTPAVRFGDQIGLVKVELPSEPLSAGKAYPFTLYWTPLPGYSAKPFEVALVLLSEAGDRVWGEATPLAHDLYPREQWQPGQVLRERHAVLFLTAPPAGEYRLLMRVREWADAKKPVPLACDRPNDPAAPGVYLVGTVTVRGDEESERRGPE